MKKDPQTKEELLRQVDELERVAKKMAQSGILSTAKTPPIIDRSNAGVYAEVKIWHRDGRVETIRCEAVSMDVRDPRNGMTKSVLSGVRERYIEGDLIAFNGKLRAWKRGPDGRPVK